LQVVNEILHCDLESRSRSLVFKIDLHHARIQLCNEFWDSTYNLREDIVVNKVLNDYLHCDLESSSRSLVFELNQGLAQIHLWYKLGDCT